MVCALIASALFCCCFVGCFGLFWCLVSALLWDFVSDCGCLVVMFYAIACGVV